MSKRDFFRIVIKLFGLYSLVLSILYYLPSSITYFYYDFDFWTLLWVLGLAAIVILVYVFLI